MSPTGLMKHTTSRTISTVSSRRGMAVLVIAVAACTSTGDGIDLTATTTTTFVTTPTTLTTTTTTTIPIVFVMGRAVDPDGSPVARALVEMGPIRTVTGADGWFSLETTDPSVMTVTKPGWSSVDVPWNSETNFHEAVIDQMTVRGLRVSPDAAQDDARFASLLQLAAATAVNTLVFDSKQEGGQILYDTAMAEAHEIGAVEVFYDPRERIAQAHDAGLYTITRIVAFEDRVRVNARPDEKYAGVWLDPTAEGARAYILELAVEACELGFDEIQFDYVRYPSGRTAQASGQLDLPQAQRVNAISTFLSEARTRLHSLGCAVSADVFGIVLSSDDDQGLGQRPEELSAQVDALSPMVYPSHYSLGWLGLPDPNDHPYDVTAYAIQAGLARVDDSSILRPWLQGFWWTNAQIRSSIQAAEDHGVGWMLWNILSNYDAAALPTDDEVAP